MFFLLFINKNIFQFYHNSLSQTKPCSKDPRALFSCHCPTTSRQNSRLSTSNKRSKNHYSHSKPRNLLTSTCTSKKENFLPAVTLITDPVCSILRLITTQSLKLAELFAVYSTVGPPLPILTPKGRLKSNSAQQAWRIIRDWNLVRSSTSRVFRTWRNAWTMHESNPSSSIEFLRTWVPEMICSRSLRITCWKDKVLKRKTLWKLRVKTSTFSNQPRFQGIFWKKLLTRQMFFSQHFRGKDCNY